MAVARIRTSDPEIVEFLSRHLADSGYQLQFVRPGEPVQGEAELEIDATRMDLAAAMAASRHETGFISVLSGVLKSEPQRDIFEEAAQSPVHREYADVSPYAQGAELEDQPSAIHRAADVMASALGAGVNSVGRATKAASQKFGAWKAQREAERWARREQREQEMALEAERRREQQARQAEEDARRRAEEERMRAEQERLAAIRREEQMKLQAEEQRRREEQARLEAIAAQKRAEEERRAQAEAARLRAEEEAQLRARAEQERAEEEIRSKEQERIRAEEERHRADELAAAVAERQLQEQLQSTQVPEVEEESRRALEQSQVAEDARLHEEQVWQRAEEERRFVAEVSRENSLQEAEAATVEDLAAEPEWQPVEVPEPSRQQPVAQIPVRSDRRHKPRRLAGNRERVFKRAGVAAAIVAVGVISLWSLASIRRPANPLNNEQLVRSATVEQQKPFGPAATVAPVRQPSTPVMRPAVPPKKTAANKAKPRASKTSSGKTHVAKRTSADDGDEVVVRHFTAQKQVQAKAKTKNGVKIISESD